MKELLQLLFVLPLICCCITRHSTAVENVAIPNAESRLYESFPDDVEDSTQFIDENFGGDNYVINSAYTNKYFSHLDNNFPTNSFGICGYTAISMLLSYFDSYWNDNIIDEWYESALPSSLTSNDYKDLGINYYHSPGVSETIVYGNGYDRDYYINLVETENPNCVPGDEVWCTALDALLTPMVYQQIQSNSFLGKLFYTAIATGVLTPHRDMEGVLIDPNHYITSLGVTYEKVNNILYGYFLNNNYMNNRFDTVSSRMSTYNQNNPDYYSEKQRIRSEIIEILQSGRPVLVGGSHFDGSEIVGHACIAYAYDNVNDKIIGNLGGSYLTASILDNYFDINYKYYFSLYIHDEATQSITNNYYFSDKTAYYSPGTNSLFNKIAPTDFGFPDAYNQTEISSNLTIYSLDPNGTNEVVGVKRVRTGYIHNECINLSTKRRAPGISYLELTFPRDIKYLTIDISWWSATEMVTWANSEYFIQGKDGGMFYNYKDIWYENISTDRTHPTKMKVEFEQGISTIRFYGSTTDYTNDRNKGRLSLFNMVVEYWDFSL